jgi:phospholipase/carboxylesterase
MGMLRIYRIRRTRFATAATQPGVSGYIKSMLETIEVETAPQPNAAIIWLHGLGADGHDFEAIVPELVPRGSRAWRFVFPNAPVRPVTINGGMRMRAWYDIVGLDREAAEDADWFKDTDQKVRELIAREAARGIPADRVVLAGFSQGGAVSLYTAPRLADKLAGVMALSCYLPREGTFQAERAPANAATPIFMAHGQFDGVVPLMLGVKSRDYLRGQGYKVEWHEYAMEHSVCAEEVADIRQFLLSVLP